jgi:hypothetical protein
MIMIAVCDLSRADAAALPPVLLDAPCTSNTRAAHFVACNGDVGVNWDRRGHQPHNTLLLQGAKNQRTLSEDYTFFFHYC